MKITEWLYFAMLLCFAWFMGMQYERGNTKHCIEQTPRQQSYPKTKKEVAAFIKSHHEQDRGWVK